MSGSSSNKARRIVAILSGLFGEISWWPGDTDEVIIGAILTQQTRWENVEQALLRLKNENLATMSAIHAAGPVTIEEAVRCTGFYHIKARRLKALAAHVTNTYGGVERMVAVPTPELRAGLLAVKGIGEETADSILCYGFSRTSFVIDAYTERIVRCAGIPDKRSDLKELFETVLHTDPYVYRQTHAHIVEYAKRFCTKKRCDACQIAILNR
jgi:endonuclease III related protein